MIETTNDFKRICMKKGKKACIISLLDGRTHKKSFESNFDNKISITENIIDKFKGKPFSFAWVNSTCHVINIIIKIYRPSY